MESAIVNSGKDFGRFDGGDEVRIQNNQPGTRSEQHQNQSGNASTVSGGAESSANSSCYQGFEDFFHAGKSRSEDQNQTGTTVVTGLTLKEAVEFYKISEKTIRLHISQGKIPARKEQGPRGLEWRIYPSGIPAEPEIIEDVTEVQPEGNHAGTTAEEDRNRVGTILEPGSETVPNRQASGELDKLLGLVQAQAQKLEAANYRIGYLEAQTQTYKEQIKLLTDSQHKSGWWVRFCSWFIGR